MTFKGIFFDLYGTLLIYEDVQAGWADWLVAFHECLSRGGLSMPKEAFAQRCDGFFGRPVSPPQEDGLTIYERRIRDFCVELGLDLSDLEIQKAADATIAAWRVHMPLDPDALPTLKALKARKKLALVSNFDHPPHIYLLLAELGLAGFFGTVIVSGEVGVEKPDPAIFSLALRRTGLQPHEVAYVGDTLEDVRGARAAGLYPVLVRRGRADVEQAVADFRVDRQPAEEAAVDDAGGAEVISRLSELVKMFCQET